MDVSCGRAHRARRSARSVRFGPGIAKRDGSGSGNDHGWPDEWVGRTAVPLSRMSAARAARVSSSCNRNGG